MKETCAASASLSRSHAPDPVARLSQDDWGRIGVQELPEGNMYDDPTAYGAPLRIFLFGLSPIAFGSTIPVHKAVNGYPCPVTLNLRVPTYKDTPPPLRQGGPTE